MKNRIIFGVLTVLLLCGASTLNAQRGGRGGAQLVQILDSKTGSGESSEIAKDIPGVTRKLRLHCVVHVLSRVATLLCSYWTVLLLLWTSCRL